MKNYLVDVYKETLKKVLHSIDEKFDNTVLAYSDFITSLDCVVNTIAPFKTVRVKNITSDRWHKLLKRFRYILMTKYKKRCKTQSKI